MSRGGLGVGRSTNGKEKVTPGRAMDTNRKTEVSVTWTSKNKKKKNSVISNLKSKKNTTHFHGGQ